MPLSFSDALQAIDFTGLDTSVETARKRECVRYVWREHSCLPRRDSSRRTAGVKHNRNAMYYLRRWAQKPSDIAQECVRHG
jgi:hypothetical protein